MRLRISVFPIVLLSLLYTQYMSGTWEDRQIRVENTDLQSNVLAQHVRGHYLTENSANEILFKLMMYLNDMTAAANETPEMELKLGRWARTK